MQSSLFISLFLRVIGLPLTSLYKKVIINSNSINYRSYMQVSMQEFKSHLSHYVSEAQSGQLVELTSHRKVVARIIGVPSSASAGFRVYWLRV